MIRITLICASFLVVGAMDYEDEMMSKENWRAAEEVAMRHAEDNARRYEIEALREALEFTDAPHERRYIERKIRELESR